MASACQFLRIPALPWCVKPGPDLKYGYMQEETRLLYYSVGVATKTHCQGSDRVLHKLCCALLLDLPVVFSAASFASLDLCLLKWYLPGNSLEDVKAWAWASMGIWTLGLLRTRCSHRPARLCFRKILVGEECRAPPLDLLSYTHHAGLRFSAGVWGARGPGFLDILKT